ncbi:MAG: SufS family cysteine desulfurase [Patescibacteria group bacterium]
MNNNTANQILPLSRELFPTLANNKSLIYLDSAASMQTPHVVLDAMNSYYEQYRSNIHRGLYTISEKATTAYEAARANVARFINADPAEVIFTRGATEALNVIALGWAEQFIPRGQEILVSILEHHSNIVPWQMLAKRKGLKLRFFDITPDGQIDEDAFTKMLSKQTGLVCITAVSNALGTVTPIKRIIQKSYAARAKVVLDAAQAAAHLGARADLLGGPDFIVFAGHKMYGPTGIGVLYGKRQLLEQMDPVFGGGEMIREVMTERSTWNSLPWKLEAGTPPIAEAIGLSAAIDFIRDIGLSKIHDYEQSLTSYALDKLKQLPFIQIYGPADINFRSSIISFNIDGVHAHDVAALLDEKGIAIRAGHHCCMPLMQRLKVPATARISLAAYNTMEEIDTLVTSLKTIHAIFHRTHGKKITQPAHTLGNLAKAK